MRVCSYSGKDGHMRELEGATISINVRSFRGAVVVLKVSKQPGMEAVNLLTEDQKPGHSAGDSDDSSNLWNTLSRCVHVYMHYTYTQVDMTLYHISSLHVCVHAYCILHSMCPPRSKHTPSCLLEYKM